MQQEEWGKIRTERAKSDLIGTIHNSEVYELLGFHKITTAGEKKSWEAFTEAMRLCMEDRAQDFGNEREETGFRLGFHMAMRLCMEGLQGGIRL